MFAYHKLDEDVYSTLTLSVAAKGQLHQEFENNQVFFFFFFGPTTVKVKQCFEEKLAKQYCHPRQTISRMVLYTAHNMAAAFTK